MSAVAQSRLLTGLPIAMRQDYPHLVVAKVASTHAPGRSLAGRSPKLSATSVREANPAAAGGIVTAVSMIRDLSSRRTPFFGKMSPVARIALGDSTLQSLLRDLDVCLLFVHLDYPAQLRDTPPDELLLEVDATSLERLRKSRAYLVIDHSGEGHAHSPEFSSQLHAWCSLRGVPPSALIYVNTNYAWNDAYRAWCRELGADDNYAHLNFNTYVYAVATAFTQDEVGQAEVRLLHEGERPYRYLCLNHVARAERLLIAKHLLSREPTDSLVSLGSSKGRTTPDRSIQQVDKDYRRARLLDVHPDLFEGLDYDDLQLRANLPRPTSDGTVPLHRRFDYELYAKTSISVVTETEMSRGPIRRITEKTIKPLMFGHVALVAGNQGSLMIARDLGFATFSPVIDESYDEVRDPNDRLCAVLCEIDRLRSLDEVRFVEVVAELAEVRRANLRYGREVLARRMRARLLLGMRQHILDRAKVAS